ncbi:hypothetical protein JD844_032447, partial [Phrynosoma platyrhinos]
ITELCGAKRVGYFGRAQFYTALKLIAATQSGLPVRIESIQNELPLPRFMALKTDGETRYSHPTEALGVKFQITHAPVDKNCFRRLDEGEKQQEAKSPPMSPIGSPPASPSSYQRISLNYGYGILRSGLEQQHGGKIPGIESHCVSVPTKPEFFLISKMEQHQEAMDQNLYQHIPHSFGFEWARKQFEKQHATSEIQEDRTILVKSISVERELQDSSSNYPDDPWRITEEQREYYINQFKSLQPDLNSFITGSVAKNFFTKSKLPIPELSHIWELSDVDRDGALTLAEFCAAFHLIVARKNGYLLPDTLPETLLPGYLQAASLKSKSDHVLNSYSESLSINQQTRDFSRTEETTLEEMPDKAPLTQDTIKDDKQGLKISASAQAVPKEFKVSQHLAIKTVTQESNTVKARPRSRSYSSSEDAVKKGGEPPTPPPRPQKSHSRASSLDLNKIFQQNTQALRAGWLPPPPPALPPRPFVSQASHPITNAESNGQLKSSYIDFRLQEQEVLLTQPPSKPVRRKFWPEGQMLENQEVSPTKSVASSLPAIKSHHSIPRQSSKQKKAIQTAIRKNKEANAVLARLNSELQQQLKEVHKERSALESQLEQLRPVTVL